MDKSQLIKYLEEKLQESQNQLQRLKNESNPSSIDIDLLLQHLRNGYEDALKLKSNTPEKTETKQEESEGPLNSAQEEADEPATEAEFDPNSMLEDSDLMPPASNEDNESNGEASDEIETPSETIESKHHNTTSEPTESADESKIQPNSTTESDKQNSEPTGKPLHHKFQTEANSSLNDRLKQREKNKALADKWQLSPISDLKDAIKLNERQSFIKELFHGDTEAYRAVVRNLNKNFNNYSEALAYLENEVKPNYKWDEESETTAKFVELVYRRHLSSE